MSRAICNLRYFEIALRKLDIANLLTNLETEIRFRNCVALLRILKIASFLKQTPPIDAIEAHTARSSIVYSCCVQQRKADLFLFLNPENLDAGSLTLNTNS